MPQRTAEERKAYLKEYRIKNAEKLKAYYIKNAEKIKAQNKAWCQNNPEKCKKIKTITDWKIKGLICDDYGKLYDLYLQSTNCEECDCKYSIKGDGVGRFKCMDHCHTTGLFRNFLCSKCNLHRG